MKFISLHNSCLGIFKMNHVMRRADYSGYVASLQSENTG